MFNWRFISDYLKSRLPILFAIFFIGLCAVTSVVYSKYVTEVKDQGGVIITSDGKLNITVNKASDTPNHYKITNDNVIDDPSNMPAYIRFTVAATWVNSDGQVWAIPINSDQYTVTISEGDYSVLSDGYYYYNGVLKPTESFNVLVTLKDHVSKPGSTYTMRVDILAEGIQIVPATASEDAWNASYGTSGWSDK